MDKKKSPMAEFEEKHGINFHGNTVEELMFFALLDDIYLKFTPEKAADMIKDFFNYADAIFNEIKENLDQTLDTLMPSIDDESTDGEA